MFDVFPTPRVLNYYSWVEVKPVILRERRVYGNNLRIGLYTVTLESKVKGKKS
jgi:hypothetical protein